MSLLDQAKLDVASILGDVTFGFASSVLMREPSGPLVPIAGAWNDINRAVDPDTGIPVNAQTVTFVVSFSALSAAGFVERPRAEMDNTKKPWVLVKDLATYRVKQVDPDETAEALTLTLERYT